MLREVDVPTRIVNGFYGAHYNSLGDFYAVRQADAHSWVEVYFDGLGWVTFDPTPPTGRTAGDAAALWPALSQATDALRNAYLEYVIDYNLTKQLALLEEMGVRQPGAGGPLRVRWSGIAIYALGLGACVAVLLWWRRRRRGQGPSYVRLYGKLLALLSSRGYERDPYESPTRFARRLGRQDVCGAEDLERFAILYEQQRFGAAITAAASVELERLARQATKTLRKGVRVRGRRAPSHGATGSFRKD